MSTRPHLRLITGGICALLFVTATSNAMEMPQTKETPAAYPSVTSLDLTQLLPAPPSIDSPEQKAEVEAILATQKAATEARVAQAVEDSKGSVFDMFGKVLGPSFTASALPATAKLFGRVGSSEMAIVGPAQKAFNRTRPFAADQRVQVLSKASMMSASMAESAGEAMPKSGSWPSGRATRVTASVIVLAALVPEHKAALWIRSQDYAQSRIVAGMHYPQDLEMGYRAGTALASLLFTDAEFKAELSAAKQELRAALGLK